jgi:hypothetical protein
LLTAASINDGRTDARPFQAERSASDADDNWTALYAPPIARFSELGMSVSGQPHRKFDETSEVLPN